MSLAIDAYQYDTVFYLSRDREALQQYVQGLEADKVLVVGDTNTMQRCLPVLEDNFLSLQGAETYTIAAGETSKSLEELQGFYKYLLEAGLSRRSLMLILGGGVCTDFFGFAAATYMRGVPHLFVPTTLLAMVDAALGGKRGVNFLSHKNRLGCIEQGNKIFISALFLKTLKREDLLSGLAEMLKHAILDGEACLEKILSIDEPWGLEQEQLEELIRESIQIKETYVDRDIHDTATRHCLNLGHTFAHAIEAWSFNEQRQSISHGHAVAAGLVMILSHAVSSAAFPRDIAERICLWIQRHYPNLNLKEQDFESIWAWMRYDKKNHHGKVSVVLPSRPGLVSAAQPLSKEEARRAFQYYIEQI